MEKQQLAGFSGFAVCLKPHRQKYAHTHIQGALPLNTQCLYFD